MTDTRAKAAAILSGHKLQMLEDAGLTVIEQERLKELTDDLHAETEKSFWQAKEIAQLQAKIMDYQATAKRLDALERLYEASKTWLHVELEDTEVTVKFCAWSSAVRNLEAMDE